MKATSSDELATSELVSEVIGSGDFLMTLKIKMSGSGNPDHTSYSHELRMLDDSGEYIIDDESITEWEEKKNSVDIFHPLVHPPRRHRPLHDVVSPLAVHPDVRV